MSPHSPVLKTLAQLFARSQTGRSGVGLIDFQPDLKAVLRAAGCEDGDIRAQALQDLETAEAAGIIILERHRRDSGIILKIRVPPANESALFERVGELSPLQRRQELAKQFEHAVQTDVPEQWRNAWNNFCARMAEAARTGSTVAPFERENLVANVELLTLLPKLLAWKSESLVRFCSCVLCDNSKRLEELAATEKEGELRGKLRGKLGRALEAMTSGEIRTLDDLGILPNPRSVLVHGPLRLRLDGEWLDLGRLNGSFRLSQIDIERAEGLITAAQRCLTVENETSFHELIKLRSGVLLVHTSYPGSATVKFLQRLNGLSEFWHFGDSDEDGFAILRVLSQKSGRDFKPLHMERGRLRFEQEALGPPTRRDWPFYD